VPHASKCRPHPHQLLSCPCGADRYSSKAVICIGRGTCRAHAAHIPAGPFRTRHCAQGCDHRTMIYAVPAEKYTQSYFLSRFFHAAPLRRGILSVSPSRRAHAILFLSLSGPINLQRKIAVRAYSIGLGRALGATPHLPRPVRQPTHSSRTSRHAPIRANRPTTRAGGLPTPCAKLPTGAHRALAALPTRQASHRRVASRRC